jgi:tRNA pseudouridine38-40 synthase
MARFKLLIEYDGSNFHGWQVQKGAQTIQGKFFDACKIVFKAEKFDFYGAGRTDSGVHAIEQAAHLDVKTNLQARQIMLALNDELPASINILGIEPVDADFHARHSAVSRSYIYHISRRRTAFGKKYVWWIKDKLNPALMQQAAGSFVGMHDYKSFGTAEKEDASTLVKMESVNVSYNDNNIIIRIHGSHFLWKQVRRMVGVLAEVGRKNLSAADINNFLENYSDVPAKYTAPPSGLYLEKVLYNHNEPIQDIIPLLNL